MFLRKYGVAAQIDGIPLITRGAVDYKANPTLAPGDVTISKDGGAFGNIEGAGVFADFVAVAPAAGTSVQVKPDAAALVCKSLVVRFIDQTAPKEWEDQEIIIETFGHASALYTGDINNLDAAVTSRPTLADMLAGGLALEATLAALLGTGDTAVDHNTGADGSYDEDYLQAVYAGNPVDNAMIEAYQCTLAQYNAGNRGGRKGKSETKTDGRWLRPMMLDHGFTYTIVCYKQGAFQPYAVQIVLP